MLDICKQIGLFLLDIVRLYLLLTILLSEPFKSKLKFIACSIGGLFVYAELIAYLPQYATYLEIIITIILLCIVLKKKNIGIVVLAFWTRELLDTINLELAIALTGLTGTEILNDYLMMIILSSSLVIVLMICLSTKDKDKIKVGEWQLNKSTQMTIIIGVMALGAMITFVQMIVLENTSDKILRVGAFILGMGGLSIFVAMFGAVYFYMKNDVLINEMRFNEEMMVQQKKYFVELLDKEEKTKQFRHDIRAHISSIKEYIQEKDYTRLKQYVDDMDIKVNEMKPDIQTGNHAINAVVSDILRSFPNVKIIWEGMVPNNLNIKMMDLCIIFSNLLNNACREVQLLEQHREVMVNLKILEPAIMIYVENYTDNDVKIDENYCVVKTHEYGHGYGLRNVYESVLNYGGEFEIVCKDNKFIASIVLPNALK